MTILTINLGAGVGATVTERLLNDPNKAGANAIDVHIYAVPGISGNDSHVDTGCQGSGNNCAVIEHKPDVS